MRNNQRLEVRAVKERFPPRKAYFYERSFVVALLPAIIALLVMLFWGGTFAENVGGGYSPAVAIIPLTLVSAIILSYAFSIRKDILTEVQKLKGEGEAIKTLFEIKKDLRQAYLQAIDALAEILRGETNGDYETKALAAVNSLYTAYGAEDATRSNSVIPRFVSSYMLVISSKIRSSPQAIVIASILFLGAAAAPVLFNDKPVDQVALVVLTYAFSVLLMVSNNMLRVFGTKGSQLRVTETLNALLRGMEDEE